MSCCHDSYQPPTLPATSAPEVTRASVSSWSVGLQVRPAGVLDVDAALRDLGMDVEETDSTDGSGDELADFLARCLDGGHDSQVGDVRDASCVDLADLLGEPDHQESRQVGILRRVAWMMQAAGMETPP